MRRRGRPPKYLSKLDATKANRKKAAVRSAAQRARRRGEATGDAKLIRRPTNEAHQNEGADIILGARDSEGLQPFTEAIIDARNDSRDGDVRQQSGSTAPADTSLQGKALGLPQLDHRANDVEPGSFSESMYHIEDDCNIAIFDDDDDDGDDDDDEELNDTREISTQAAGRRLCNDEEANSATLQERDPQLENEEAYHGNGTDSPLIEDICEGENVVDEDPSVARKLALQLRHFQSCQEEEHNFLHAEHLSNHERSDVSSTCNSLQSIA